MKKLILRTAVVLLSAMMYNCSSAPTFQEINAKSNEMYDLAMDMEKNGKQEEALRLMVILSGLYGDDPKVKDYISKASAETKEEVMNDGMIGFNKGIRAKVTPTTMEKVLWYIPDRILDLVEVFDIWVNLGPQLGLGYKLTGALQAEAFVGGYVGVGYGQKKMLGLKTEGRSALVIGPFGPVATAGSSIGTGGFQFGAGMEVFHTPSKALYQDMKDYWGIGGRVGVVYLGVEAEIHPIELVDFLGGIFLFDPLNDDFATTRSLKFTSRQRDVVKSYVSIVRQFEAEDIDQYKKKYPTLSSSGAEAEAPKKDTPKKK